MSRGRLVIVEDDVSIRRGLADALTHAGYEVVEASDGASGLGAACTPGVDLVLLDVLMPGMDGFEVLAELRRSRPGLAVIFLTARGEPEDRVRGLRGGADDYVVKPFGLGEVLARIEAVLRRSAERPCELGTLELAGRTVDLRTRVVTRPDGSRVELTEREAEVLHYLASAPGRPVSRDELLRRVWGIDPRGVRSRTVDMAIARLREHLGDDPAWPEMIRTVRARGYMLALEPV